MHWLDGKAGRILHLHSQDVDKAQGWFDHHGKATVFFCRFVPLIRSLISLPAGMARMNLPGFVILTTVGSAIWNVVLILLGAWFGDAWEQVVCYLDTYAYVALSVFGAVVLVIFIWFKRRTQAAKKG